MGQFLISTYIPSEKALFMNTIKNAPLRVMLAVENGDLYIHPNNMFMKARVKYYAHTHPHNSLPNEHDARLILDILGLQEGIVNCWNGTSYLYIGPTPITTYYFPSH